MTPVLFDYESNAKKIEDELSDTLMMIILYLLMQLKDLTPLTRFSIEMVVANFYSKYKDEINRLSSKNVDSITALVEKVLEKVPEKEAQGVEENPNVSEEVKPVSTLDQHIKSIRKYLDKTKISDSKITDKYIQSNTALIDLIIEGVKNRFIQLSIIENNYTLASEVKQDEIDAIIKATKDKIMTFSEMTTISTIREILFSEAKDLGYTEYQWQTMLDDRVRPTHKKMEGVWVKFDKPPKETGYYHVQEDWGCRCRAYRFR